MQDVKPKNGMSFAEACAEAAQIPEFVENFNRLTGIILDFARLKMALRPPFIMLQAFKGLTKARQKNS